MDSRRNESVLLRWYRTLTHFYPSAFRDEYETELVETVREREQERTGIKAALWLWAELAADLATTAPKEHWNMLKQDLQVASRIMRKTPWVTITAVIVLALGIGATTTVFSIVNAVLLRPLPFADPERLVFIEETSVSQAIDRMGPAFPNWLDYKSQARQFESMGAWAIGGITLTGQGEPERVDGAWVSASLFPTLGVQPLIGRGFLPEEDQPKVENAVLLSYGLWQRKFAGDRSVVGRSINVNGKPRTVVGIMPAGFRFPEAADIWGTLSLDPRENRRTDHFLSVIGRLRPGVSATQGEAELATVLKGIQGRYPDETSELGIRVTPARDQLTSEYGPSLVRLLAAVALVLAIACTNIMNLLLARATGRSREVAIRTALGAHRRRIIRQLMTESMVLGILGGGLGVVVGVATLKGLVRLSPVDIPYWVDLRMDWRVLAFCAIVTLGSVFLFGIAPAWKVSAITPGAALNEFRRGMTSSAIATRLRQGLVSVQVALSVVLLVGAGLMIRSFLNLQDFDLGFRARDTLSFRVALPPARYKNPADRDALLRRMREQLAAVPGVRNVATATSLPLGASWWRTFQKTGETKTRPGDLPSAYHVMVSPGYFGAMGIPLKRGRDFTSADGKTDPVVIVSENLARKHWPDRDAIGQQIRIDPFLPGEPWRRVVGIAGDVRVQGARKEPPFALYVPESFDPRYTVSVVMKTDLPPVTQANAARQVMRGLDPELPLYSVAPVAKAVGEAAWQFRFFTFLLTAFAGLAVLLASVGLGGIVASMVVERTHEIGVRMAVGASAGHVVRMVLSRAFALTAAGVAAGILAAFVVTRALESQLFEVRRNDALTFTAAIGLLIFAAFASAWIPARRASRVDPSGALRAE